MRNKTRLVTIGAVMLQTLALTSFVGKVEALTGDISVIAGDGLSGFSGDGGPATQAQFNYTNDLTVTPDGTIYLADLQNRRVRKIDTSGIVTTTALLNGNVYSVAVDPAGDVYALWDCCTITKIDGSGSTTNVGGGPRNTGDIAFDNFGTLYFSDDYHGQLFRFDEAGEPVLVARRSESGLEDDETVIQTLVYISDFDLDASGNIYIVDSDSRRVYKRDPLGQVTTFAGTGIRGSTGDGGPATQARLDEPRSITTSPDGSVYIASWSSIRKVDPSGNICTVERYSSYFSGITDLATDSQGDLYVSTYDRTWKIETPDCRRTIKYLIDQDTDLEIFQQLVEASNFVNLDSCDFYGSVFAPTDAAFEDIATQLGTAIPELVSNQILLNAILNDHLTYFTIQPTEIESDSFTNRPSRSNLQLNFTQSPAGPAGTRRIGENVFVNGAKILRGARACNSSIYVIDSFTSWPPSSLRAPIQWTGPASPTSSKNLLFRLDFVEPVSGITSADFENLGTQKNCNTTVTKGTVLSEFSNFYFLYVTCEGTGTVALRLKKSSLVTPNGTRIARDFGAPVIDIVADRVLTISKTGDGTGLVESTISAISCGVLCSGVFPSGTQVTLRATPQPGSLFVGWSGACRGTGTCTVRMSSPQTVTAQFRLAGAIVITKTGSGTGSITSRTSGINCGATAQTPCVSWHLRDVQITLLATPARGSRFVGWMGACSGTGTCTVTASGWSNGNFEEATHVFPIFERT